MNEHDNVQGEGRFMQIKAHEDHRQFEVLDIWTAVVPAKQAHPVITKLKAKLAVDTSSASLVHIKRIYKENIVDNVQYMRMAICTVDQVPEISRVESLLQDCGIEHPTVERRHCSRYQGKTKAETEEWAQRAGWPMIWRGNVDLIPTPLPDPDKAHYYLEQVAQLGVQSCAPVCMIVDPVKDKVLVTKTDSRKNSKNPLNHCIMDAIHETAQLETERRQTSYLDPDERLYLCLNMHVFVTHEPCVMCAMALNHSRVARLFYVKSSPRTGGIEPTSGGGHCVHWNKNLNWSYEVWKYIRDGIDVHSVPEECNV